MSNDATAGNPVTEHDGPGGAGTQGEDAAARRQGMADVDPQVRAVVDTVEATGTDASSEEVLEHAERAVADLSEQPITAFTTPLATNRVRNELHTPDPDV